MRLDVFRFGDNGDTTGGVFMIDGIFQCMSIEDQEQKGEKIKHETRVTEGTYNVSLRAEGGFHNRYAAKYPDIHKGMLCIHNAPNWKIKCPDGKEFQYILIHVGNTDDHTSGCLLLNYGFDGKTFRGSNSGNAYKDAYVKIVAALERGEEVTITYHDIEGGK